MTLLGSPILKGKAQDQVIQRKIEELKMAIIRLSLLQSHDALVLLKNSLSLPKLFYLLRTADCSDNMLLLTFDDALRSGLSTILNINLNDDQWIQASLPVRNGGLGIRSAQMLAPSAFLASAASTREVQDSILPHNIRLLEDKSVTENETRWLAMTEAPKSVAELQHIQKASSSVDRREPRTKTVRPDDVDAADRRTISSTERDWCRRAPCRRSAAPDVVRPATGDVALS